MNNQDNTADLLFVTFFLLGILILALNYFLFQSHILSIIGAFVIYGVAPILIMYLKRKGSLQMSNKAFWGRVIVVIFAGALLFEFLRV
jgi:hypothetical protein